MPGEALETGLVLPGVVVPVGFGEVRVRVVPPTRAVVGREAVPVV